MRQRRRHHTDERLLLSSTYFIDTPDCPVNTLVAAEQKAYIDWDAVFGLRQPISLEIGCGKGSFAVEYARRHPDENVVAVERNANVILAAMENAETNKLPNLRLLHLPCEVLTRYFRPESVSKIFLNFSTPLPRAPFVRQRLTNPRFLTLYDEMLQVGGKIYLKTDSEPFFSYSLEEIKNYGFAVERAETDLYKTDLIETNIATEYENRFVKQGLPIFAIIARKEK